MSFVLTFLVWYKWSWADIYRSMKIPHWAYTQCLCWILHIYVSFWMSIFHNTQSYIYIVIKAYIIWMMIEVSDRPCMNRLEYERATNVSQLNAFYVFIHAIRWKLRLPEGNETFFFLADFINCCFVCINTIVNRMISCDEGEMNDYHFRVFVLHVTGFYKQFDLIQIASNVTKFVLLRKTLKLSRIRNYNELIIEKVSFKTTKHLANTISHSIPCELYAFQPTRKMCGRKYKKKSEIHL